MYDIINEFCEANYRILEMYYGIDGFCLCPSNKIHTRFSPGMSSGTCILHCIEIGEHIEYDSLTLLIIPVV